MKTVAIRISEEMHRKIKVYAAKQGRTIADIVAELIEKELKEKEQTQ